MYNLLKMDLYRLVHAAYAWVILLFAVLTALFAVAMTDLEIQDSQKAAALSAKESSEKEDSAELVIGVGTTKIENEEWADGRIGLCEVVTVEVQSGLTAILCVIFSALFSNADQKNGYIKNIAGQFPGRAGLVASKMIAVAVWTFLILFVFVSATAIAGFAFWGDMVNLESWTLLIKALGAQYLLHLGLAALVLFFCILSRSTAFSVTAGILLCSGLTAYVYLGINRLLSAVKPSWSFDISNYALESNIRMLDSTSAPADLLRGAVVGIVFAVIPTVLAMAVMKKRDIQ